MPNRAEVLLTDRQVKNAKKSISVGGVRGLTLVVRKTTSGKLSKTFYLRLIISGREVNRVIGPYPETSLESAREIAKEWRAKLLAGEDPKADKRVEQAQKVQEMIARKNYSVQSMLLDYCDFGEKRIWNESTIKGQKISTPHINTVMGWMRNHIPEDILLMQAKLLTPEILAKAFKHKWLTMVDTPDRIIGEIRRAFDYAMRSGKVPMMLNPADLHGKLGDLLPPVSERAQKSHHPALPPERIPELFAELQKHPGITSKLIQYTILTASRATNSRLVIWSEIMLDKKHHQDAPIQVTKRDEMKVKRVIKFDRETPLSPQAVNILKTLPKFVYDKGPNFVFAKVDDQGVLQPLSNAAIATMLRKINMERRQDGRSPFVDSNILRDGEPACITVHGTARASFETWAYDSVKFSHKPFSEKAIEHCLDHVTEKYNNAYLRRAVVGEMREIFEEWGSFCYSKVNRN